MGTVLGYIIALLVVGGLLFLAASYTFGRGEEMAPVLPDGTPVELPDDRLAGGDDLRALRLSVAVRGYRMDEVDWLLDRMAEQVDTRDREIARLRSVLHVEPVEPELLTHPFPPVVDATDYQAEHAREDTPLARASDADGDADDADGLDRPVRSDDADEGDWLDRPGRSDAAEDGDRLARAARSDDADDGDWLDRPGRSDAADDGWPEEPGRAAADERLGSGESGWGPREVPDGTGDTGARPNQPAKHVRTADRPEPE